ncbi:septum site-determining protein Ssd [Cellulomonas algicola]|uniref:septum site-determining protein Ssd n=1 Tax=Cellulomonas algicola TaxID=2071633 RepID=UPI001C3FC892|nr:septum site-determining protein Ssd [Cellulomonas algicola]
MGVLTGTHRPVAVERPPDHAVPREPAAGLQPWPVASTPPTARGWSSPPAPPVWRAHVVGVVGARGGAGASSLAAALARAVSRTTATALVDLDGGCGGLDVLLGLEGADGVRWPDLTDARGDVDGHDLLALLPRWGACAVLSADRARPDPPEPAVVADVLHALSCTVGVLVLDLDRSRVVAGESVAAVCDTVLVVAPRDLRATAGALALRHVLDVPGADVGLVVRGPAPGGLGASEVAEAVGLPVRAVLPVDRRLAAGTEHGGIPTTGPFARAVRRLAAGLAR